MSVLSLLQKLQLHFLPGRSYLGYQRFFLVCDEELRRSQAEDTSG